MKYDVQNIVNEVLEGSREWTERLPELLKDREFRQKYVRLMIDESLISDAVAVEAQHLGVTGHKTRAQTGQVRTLRKTVKHNAAFKIIAPHFSAGL